MKCNQALCDMAKDPSAGSTPIAQLLMEQNSTIVDIVDIGQLYWT